MSRVIEASDRPRASSVWAALTNGVKGIELQSPVTDQEEALRTLARLLSPAPADEPRIERLLAEREAVSSTSIGHGVALPHCRLPEATDSRIALLCTRAAIDVRGAEAQGVRIFVGVTSAPTGAEHLQILARLAIVFRHEEVRAAVFAAVDPKALRNHLDALDHEIGHHGHP